MKSKSNIGLVTELLNPEAESSEDLKELVYAVEALHRLVSAKTGDIVLSTNEYLGDTIHSTVNSQESDKVYCKSTDGASVGDLVKFNQGAQGLECVKALYGVTSAQGFITEIVDSVLGIVIVAFSGLLKEQAGLVTGDFYTLSSVVAGELSITQINQRVGFALNSTTLYVTF